MPLQAGKCRNPLGRLPGGEGQAVPGFYSATFRNAGNGEDDAMYPIPMKSDPGFDCGFLNLRTGRGNTAGNDEVGLLNQICGAYRGLCGEGNGR